MLSKISGMGVTCLIGLMALLAMGQAQPAPQAASSKPVVYVIGDSTVKNGRDDGSNGQWGWGHILPYFFDKSKISVENHAVGGTSSRTFFQTPSMWPAVVAKLKPGDFVLMQFGHNDNTRPPESDTLRYRSTISGNGEETVEGPKSQTEKETIHTFGWYMRQMIEQAKAKGATPIVCSLIPRNNWRGDKIGRADQSYGLWAKQAAEQEHVPFLPLNTLIADRYDKEGREKVTATYFPEREGTHTNWAGAKLNAEMVVAGIKSLENCPLKDYLAADAKAPDQPDVAPRTPASRPAAGRAN